VKTEIKFEKIKQNDKNGAGRRRRAKAMGGEGKPLKRLKYSPASPHLAAPKAFGVKSEVLMREGRWEQLEKL
jgi:hypothetical protein